MSKLRLNNSIFLMFIVSENYKRSHNLSSEDFLKMNEKFHILKYIAECPDIFNNMTYEEMVKEIDYYVAA